MKERISVLVVPNDDGETSAVSILINRKHVIQTFEAVPEERLSRIVRMAYTPLDNQMAQGQD